MIVDGKEEAPKNLYNSAAPALFDRGQHNLR